MKKYNQLKEDIDSLYLREWEKADDQWKREWLELYSEVYGVELDEEVATLAATSPIWVPALKAAVATGGAYLASKGIGKMWNRHQQKKAEEKWLKGNLQSGETYSSGSKEKGINKSYTPQGNNNKNNKNNGNGKLKKAVTAGVVGTGVVSALSGNKDKSTETNYTNQLKKKNNNGSSSSPSNRNTTTSKLEFEL